MTESPQTAQLTLHTCAPPQPATIAASTRSISKIIDFHFITKFSLC